MKFPYFSENEFINTKTELLSFANCISIRREDLIHDLVSGNKFRKLKYNFRFAEENGIHTILTFGGAFSNHIAAVAAAGEAYCISTIGIIRGEELFDKIDENPTLRFAKKCGMKLYFISREDYREKQNNSFLSKLEEKFGPFYLIPEGGTNQLAVKGCTEILQKTDSKYDYICVSVGTGGTLAGIVEASLPHQKIIGFSALKGTFQSSVVKKLTAKRNFTIIDNYSFNGYAKIDSDLVRFINNFKEITNISLDPVYTGKMMYGILDLLEKDYFKKNSSILAIHTGGLQGIAGMNVKLKNKNLPQIVV